MSKIYFKKEIPANKLLDGKGQVVPFEIICADFGLLEVDSDTNPDLAKYLSDNAGHFGIVQVNAGQFDDLKKNPPASKSSAPWSRNNNLVAIQKPLGPSSKKPEGAPVVNPGPAAADQFSNVPTPGGRGAVERSKFVPRMGHKKDAQAILNQEGAPEAKTGS